MNIYFDFEVSKTPLPDTSTVKIVLEELRRFVKQRLNVLEDEMNKSDGCVVINVMGTIKDQALGLYALGYNNELRKKIMTCFSEKDFEYNYQVILKKITGQN
ncbi:MAG: hypothetical protein ABIR78_00805 [Ferruginibacter sp.]